MAGAGDHHQLALCLGSDVVVHYIIRTSTLGDHAIDGDRRRFLTLSDLVNYYQHNSAGALATRLRRPPARDNAVSLFPADIQLERSRLRFSTNIVAGVGGSAVVWKGVYNGRPVAVKVSDTLSL